MFLDFPQLKLALALVIPQVLVACGGRSGLPSEDAGTPTPCSQDEDCFDNNLCDTSACVGGFCTTVASKTCDDQNACTSDSCDPDSGNCVFTQLVQDDDRDGFHGPLPGKLAGTPNSCGNDCDDGNPNVYPGALELCDGLDNNCDGRADEGVLQYIPDTNPVRLTDDSFVNGAAAAGLAYDGSHFGVTLTGSTATGVFHGYFASVEPGGAISVPMTNETQTAQGGFGGPLLWTGSVFATAWELHAGTGNYEIFFNELDSRGQRMGPDLRLTRTAGFSISPTIARNGSGYWVAWSDDNGGTLYRIYGRTIGPDLQVASDVAALSEPSYNALTPSLLRGTSSNLLLFHSTPTESSPRKQLCGRLIDNDFAPIASSFCLPDLDIGSYSAEWVGDRFVLAWSTEGEQPGAAIWATTLDAEGHVLQTSRTITSGATFARTPRVLSLGDRFLLAWIDDRVTYDHYGVRLATYSPELSRLSNEQVIVEAANDTWGPVIAAGGAGLGLVYRERTADRIGHPYYLGLTCGYLPQ